MTSAQSTRTRANRFRNRKKRIVETIYVLMSSNNSKKSERVGGLAFGNATMQSVSQFLRVNSAMAIVCPLVRSLVPFLQPCHPSGGGRGRGQSGAGGRAAIAWSTTSTNATE